MKKVVFIAMNSKYFRIREWLTKFVFEQEAIPVNCLMLYGYYLYDMVPKEKVIEAYSEVAKKCDELWVFGEVSDGIRDAMRIARKKNMPIKYFDVSRFPHIFEVQENQLVWEGGVKFG